MSEDAPADLPDDAGLEAYIAQITRASLSMPPQPTVEQRRAHFVTTCRLFAQPRPQGLTITDTTLGSLQVPVRIYRPAGPDLHPVIAYFHGGGWVIGDLDTHDTIAAGVADLTGACVVSVHYRRAPEHPFPAAMDDVFSVVQALARAGAQHQVDGSRLAVCGDSAGGNLAAAVALRARTEGGPALRGQALVYPCLDETMQSPSYRTNAEGPLLTAEAMRDFWSAYLGGAKTTENPLAAPMRAPDLAGLPPTLVTTAGRDPLHDEGRLYAERLRLAGVVVQHRDAPRLVHGHMRARFHSTDAAGEFGALCAWLRAILA